MPQRRGTAFGSDAQHAFAMLPSANVQRSVFDRSHGQKTTFDAGYLIPIYVDEVLPGDTFKCRTSALVRLSTPYFPVMDNMYLDFFYFFVPNRLLWDNWQRFCGEQDDPADSTDFVIPVMEETVLEGVLSDYFGLPFCATPYSHSAMWHRAYNIIWKEWFRSQDLQDSPVINTDDGPDLPADYPLRRRGKRHDYFSSALPFTQKGDPVLLPLGGRADIKGMGVLDSTVTVPTAGGVMRETGQVDPATVTYPNYYAFGGTPGLWGGRVTTGVAGTAYPDIFADLSTATASTINQLRESWQVQKLLERDARGGTRYTEIVRSHFGVVSPDARLQRPEYLGGGSLRINVTPVPRTTPTTAQVASAANGAAGSLGGFGIAAGSGIGFNKSFTEHGVLIGMVSVRADLTYQQGLDKMFSRSTRYEFYWPTFAHLGEQAVLNREIFLQDTAADAEVFGYQERYAEYRYKPSRVTGAFRSDAGAPLDAWHLALDFASLPLLNDTFIQDQPPVDRVVQVATTPNFIGDFWFDLRCARPMPTYSVPGLVDHF